MMLAPSVTGATASRHVATILSITFHVPGNQAARVAAWVEGGNPVSFRMAVLDFSQPRARQRNADFRGCAMPLQVQS
jgi:hypothetical protein